MTTTKPRSTATKSRAHQPEFLDFNRKPKPAHKHAAAGVTPKQLERLFERLDRADEAFTDDDAKGARDALGAVVEFLNASPRNKGGRFSRPLELLLTELRNRPKSRAKRILPRAGGGSGGVNARPSDHRVKAAGAMAVELLHSKCGLTARAAAKAVASELLARQFAFGNKRTSDPSKAVLAWRRDYPNENNFARAAEIYRAYIANPPLRVTGDKSVRTKAVRAWFSALLARAGYGAVA